MLFRKKKAPADGLDREIRYHFERLVRDFEAEGLTPEEARRRARLEFGGIGQIQEECRDVHGHWLEDFTKDLRYAWRTLRRSPGFFVVAVLSLALGIGANTAIFSLIDVLMLRSLAVKEPSRLVRISRLGADGSAYNVSYPLFEFVRDNMKSLRGVEAHMASTPAIVLDGGEEIVTAELVSGSYFSVLGVEPAAGRLLAPADDNVSPDSPVAVISYRYWQRRFGGSPAVLGKTFNLQIQNKVVTIVGVTAPGFQGTRIGSDPDVTLPLGMMLNDEQRRSMGFNSLSMMARLAPETTPSQATAELQVLWPAYVHRAASHARANERDSALRQRIQMENGANGFSNLRGTYSKALLVLMGIVGLVLFLACANLSGLLLARAAARQREISIRLAIGAGSGRLLRQFLTESLLLATLGGGLGLLLSLWFTTALVAMIVHGRDVFLNTSPDWRTLVFTGLISLLACLGSGLAPGLHALRSTVHPSLKETRTSSHRGIGQVLVIVQLAVSMVLLVGGGFFVATLLNLYTVDSGVQTRGVLTFRVRTSEKYSPARSWTGLSNLVDRLNTMPGVASASVTDLIPISGGLWDRYVQVPDSRTHPAENQSVGFNAIGPKYFNTIGTPLLAGREFNERDTNSAPKVAIVNESFARWFFGTESPIGHRVTSVNVSYEIVGVARDAKYQSLRDDILRTMYIPCLQRDLDQPSNYAFLARVSDGDPMRLSPQLEKVIHEADPGFRLRAVQSYSDIVNGSIMRERVMAILGASFGALALLIACLGIFGLLAFQVSRRSTEIGVRMALGATRARIVALVLRDISWMLAIGCGIGAAGALALTGLTRAFLFGVTPTDPAMFAIAAAVLALAALAASWLPARRAARLDPVVALRDS